jgi:glutamyl-tRNA synthetase
MYNSFGWHPPEFCHLPMVMGQDGKKLSKRHGATSIDEFRKQGYLPDALINYIALLGASYEEGSRPEGRADIYTLDELASHFKLEKLNKAQAFFDYKKLEWYNGQYIRMKSDDDLARLCLPFAKDANLFGGEPTQQQREIFTAAMPLVKERLVFLSEVPEKIAYLFKEPELPAAEEFIPKKCDLAKTIELLRIGMELTRQLAEMPDDEQAESFIKAEAERREIKLGDLMMPMRVAITGSRVSPPLFGSLRILGAECSVERVRRALEKLEKE